MFRIDNDTASPTLKAPLQPGAPGYFTNGDPLTGEQATVVDADWMSAVQEEIAYVIEISGLVLSKTDRTQLYQALTRLTRLRLAAPATFYVDPNGNDNNPGTATQPWASLTHAYNFIRDRIDQNGQQCTVQLNDGTYSGAVFQYPAVGPWIKFQGNQSDPTKTVVHGTAGANAILVDLNASVWLDSVTLRADGAPNTGSALEVAEAQCAISNIYWDVCAFAHIKPSSGGTVGGAPAGQPGVPQGVPYTIIGGAQYHIFAESWGQVGYFGSNITILNNPLFTVCFCNIVAAGANFQEVTFTGTARGSRYALAWSGFITTATANASFLPGDAAGSNDGSGHYN